MRVRLRVRSRPSDTREGSTSTIGADMLVSVTALGARPDMTNAAAAHVVAYLEGGRAGDLSRGGSLGDGKPVLAQESGPGAYYADSTDRAGRWRGSEAARVGEVVQPEMLHRALLGQDPATGAQLVSAQGSSGRATQRRVELPAGEQDDLVTLSQAAASIGVDAGYLAPACCP